MEEQSPEKWESVEPELWKPEEEGDQVEGVLLNKEEGVGVNESKLYQLETKDGIKNVWGSTVLDNRMKLVNVGDYIKIRFDGFVKNKKGQDTKIFGISKRSSD